MPPIRVNSGSIPTRFISCTDRPTSETTAPCMMSAGAAPWERWLITSDSANTAQRLFTVVEVMLQRKARRHAKENIHIRKTQIAV